MAVIFTDDFNRGDSSDLGSDWTETVGSLAIASNQLVTTDGFTAYASDNTAVGSANYSVEADIFTSPVSGGSGGVHARYQDATNFYILYVASAENLLKLYKYNTLLGSYSTTINTSAWYNIKLMVNGTNLVAYLDGTERINVTDGTYTTEGLHGIKIGAPAPRYWEADNYVLDDLSKIYRYRKSITIDKTKVSGTNTDFPALIDVTADELKTTGNGGNVEDTNGYDLVVSSTDATDGSGTLPFDRLSYNATTGQFQAFAKAASVTDATDTVLYLLYGSSDVSTDQADADTTWSDYEGVWHLDNSMSDSTTNAKTFTDDGTSDVAGKVYRGRDFTGANNDRIYRNNDADFERNGNDPWEIGIWLNFDELQQTGYDLRLYGVSSLVDDPGWSNAIQVGHWSDSAKDGKIYAYAYDGGLKFSGGTTVAINTWYYAVAKYDGSDIWLVLDGTPSTKTSVGSIVDGDYDSLQITHQNFAGNQQRFDGQADEARFLHTPHSDGWTLTEYNNQSDPSTFYAVGSEVDTQAPPAPSAVPGSRTLRAIKLDFYRQQLSSASTSMEDLEREWMIDEGATGQSLVDLRQSFLEINIGYRLPNEWTMWEKFLDIEGVPTFTSQVDRLKYWYTTGGGTPPPGGFGDQLILQVGEDVLNIQIDDSLLLQSS